jgi:putative transposase
MTNHVHLLLTPGEASSCGDLMRELGRGYVRYFNDRHGRTGTLWEGRFRSCLVDSSAYVLACYRYIELNPVRAKMVHAPGAYKWSSYAANAGTRADPLVVPHVEYVAISADAQRRQVAYQELVQEGDAPSFLDQIRSATNAGHGLVGEQVKTQVAAMGRSLERGTPGPRRKVAAPQLVNEELLP